MLNTITELGAYTEAKNDLVRRILTDYGLIVAGWSSTYDPALRALVARYYPSRLTLAWIEPRSESIEATELRILKTACGFRPMQTLHSVT